jgi:hypothetical protein
MRTLLITLACVVPTLAVAGFDETTVVTAAPAADSARVAPEGSVSPLALPPPTAAPAPLAVAGPTAEPVGDTVGPGSEAAPAAKAKDGPVDFEDGEEPFKRYYHGFRLGYTYVNGLDSDSPLKSPHLFVIGYEATQRIEGGDWLNVIVVENVSIAGLNQSLFIPSANGLVGFEIANQIQIGTGLNFNPFDPSGKIVHQIIAAGWTPEVGKMNVPVHFTVIPDADGDWRIGSTVGVNW